MKTLPYLAVLSLCIASGVRAQPNAALKARIDQTAALFEKNPGGLDTIFTTEFLNQVPASKLIGVLGQVYSTCGHVKSWTILDSSKEWSARVSLLFEKDFVATLTISVMEVNPHKVQGLFLGPATPQIKTLSGVASKLEKLHGTTGFLAAKLPPEGGIISIAELNADSAMALGSAFKLYVLATLVKDISEGRRHWSDVITLDSASRAFPSGQMHAWPDKTPVTLETAATLMISISDNTAADLLIHTLGREKIEAMVRECGNEHADRDRPFLTTLEMFKLKSKQFEFGKNYVDLSLEAKRRYLDRQIAEYPHDSVSINGAVTMIDRIEWFASPRDIANLYRYILDRSQMGEARRVRDILTVNPGVPFDKHIWKYVGYKGGSEPGVLNMSFLLEKQSGEWFVLTGTWNDPNASLKDEEFEGLLTRALEIVP